MPKRTRSQSKAAAERVPADEAAPPVLPPSVDPALYATLMSAVSTQIAQGFKALGTAAGPSTSGTGELPKRRPPPPSDDSSESDITDAGEATYERRARTDVKQHASEPAVVYQPAECRARYHSQPSLYDMSSTAAPIFANLTLPVNARTCHVLPTPVKHIVLDFLLQDYDCPSKPALLLGFKSGFRIHSSIGSNPLKGIYENHKSVNNNLSFVQTKHDKEKSLGRVAGPFQQPPLSNTIFSPFPSHT